MATFLRLKTRAKLQLARKKSTKNMRKELKVIHPRNSTWNLEMMVSNRNLLFHGSIFRFHVCFGRCNQIKTIKQTKKIHTSFLTSTLSKLGYILLSERRYSDYNSKVAVPFCWVRHTSTCCLAVQWLMVGQVYSLCKTKT